MFKSFVNKWLSTLFLLMVVIALPVLALEAGVELDTPQATFNADTNTIHIPAIDVSDGKGNIKVYDANFRLRSGESLTFELVNANPVTGERSAWYLLW